MPRPRPVSRWRTRLLMRPWSPATSSSLSRPWPVQVLFSGSSEGESMMPKQGLRPYLGTLCLVLAICGAFACSDSPTAPPAGARFLIRQSNEDFHVLIQDPQTIAEAERQIATPSKFVTGRLLRGDGGFNGPWHWHLDPNTIAFVELSIEVCDGRPSDIETNLDYWLN